MRRTCWWAAWPSWAGSAALGWSALYAAGAALAAVTGPAFGYALPVGAGRGAAAEWALAALYGGAAVVAYGMRRRPGRAWPGRAAWAVVVLCLTSGFGFLLSLTRVLWFLSRNQPPMDWAAWANQGVAVTGAALWLAAALAHRRQRRCVCGRCGGARADGGASVEAHPARAGLVAAAAPVPYTVMKTGWALGWTAGYTGEGSPGLDPRYASDLAIRLYAHGVDATAVLAVAGTGLALALTRSWSARPVRAALLALGWAGAAALAPFGVFLAVAGALMWAGVLDMGLGDHAPWVVLVADGGFSVYGVALGRATGAYRARTRRPCARC
ncbi:hypothetical protein [Streptomyces thermolilacinus]|uniref:Uncharacterized protein n=1 Tax=Streptomyces thermolilacinus SPC6 TaxID=1306406 RepID=A0A1D3DPE7_9ACTN|nr:hypothetical protein [Streptomyces thermolilacinus]OEJ94191.1 hypothetical protein J116_006625 [Streptomyces thermolilacinus SPC6]